MPVPCLSLLLLRKKLLLFQADLKDRFAGIKLLCTAVPKLKCFWFAALFVHLGMLHPGRIARDASQPQPAGSKPNPPRLSSPEHHHKRTRRAPERPRLVRVLVLDTLCSNQRQPTPYSSVVYVPKLTPADKRDLKSPRADERAGATDPPTGALTTRCCFLSFVWVRFGSVRRPERHNRVPVVGVVFHPVSGDLYTAVQGEGACLNGAEIEVRAAEGLGDALVVNNIGAARDDAFIATTLARLGELLRRKVQAVRMSGERKEEGKSAEGGSSRRRRRRGERSEAGKKLPA